MRCLSFDCLLLLLVLANLCAVTVVTVDYPYYSFNVNVIHKCGFMMN